MEKRVKTRLTKGGCSGVAMMRCPAMAIAAVLLAAPPYRAIGTAEQHPVCP